MAEQKQSVGPTTITGPMSDTRTFSHTGSEVGDNNVERRSNVPNREDAILSWTIPKKYRRVAYAAGKHFTRAELRHRVDVTGQTGTDVELDGNADLTTIAGQKQLDEQPFPVVRVVNVSTGNELTVEDVDYPSNTVTLASDPGGDDLAVYPVINDGYIKYVGENQFEQRIGPLDPWGIPVHVFNDFRQDKNDTRIHLVGAGAFKRDEALVLVIDAPYEVVWEDDDFPEAFVSSWQQKVGVDI